jgi:carbonic anhydrase/acetyltransferase-like protein (isoleucine patch superfamily)
MGTKCEKNAVMHINSVIAPGAKLAENVSLLPFSLAIKGQKGEKSQQFLMGTPAKQKEYQGIAELVAKKLSKRNLNENKI